MPVAIPTVRAARATTHYTYYFREHEFDEHRSATFVFRLETGWYRRQARKEERRQGQYNRQALERRKRMDLLQWLTDQAAAAPSGQGAPFHSPLEILTQQYGGRWMRHPAARETLAHTGLLLRSLCNDNLVEFDGIAGYRVLPSALGMLESFVTDERRYNDSERTQRRLYWVACAAGAAAVVQAGAALWSIMLPPQQPEQNSAWTLGRRRPHQCCPRSKGPPINSEMDIQRMTSLTYEHITKRAEREIRGAMQRAAAGKIGTYGLGWTVREAGGALALWDALVATLDASVTADTREDRMRFEALEYAEHSAATPRV
ncbi:hypothetical protein [Burkholderia anthina]|uniref:hypothetical protein n=1 Tax=Burkholderia anthina TaxID=179879 RepID=UPI001FB68275|nr:hypothetical protein [Burkholderia anthina]